MPYRQILLATFVAFLLCAGGSDRAAWAQEEQLEQAVEPENAAPAAPAPQKEQAAKAASPISDAQRDNVTLLGSYLAGRAARGLRDHEAAARYLGQALALDPKSDILLEQTFILELSRGNWTQSRQLAHEVIKRGEHHRFSRMVLGLDAVLADKYGEAESQFAKSERRSPLGKMMGIVVEAWLLEAQGKSGEALKYIKRLDAMNWAKFYQDYHAAMIADQAGRHSLARKIYKRLFRKDARSLRLMEAYVRHLSTTGASKSAQKLLSRHIARNGKHPLVTSLLTRLKRGETLKLVAQTPRDGLAELYYGIGDALTGDGGVDLGMIYLQAGLRLRPDLSLASLALAEAYEKTSHYKQANQIYDKIDRDSPLWPGAAVRRAFNLNSLEKVDEAKATLDELLGRYPENITALEAQGNILRSHKRYGEAVNYYSRAIRLLKKPQKYHWKYYYSRGVCYERLKDWPKAEKDLLKARKLDRDQALVLNYLGYSWVDQGIHLPRAMRFIRRAVELKPDDGYFVDSLGWAHYRQRDYKKAVTELERAVELKPDDPVINDHLGDAYWRADRRLEAQFQWSQALTLKPEKAEIAKIRKKIADGMETDKPHKLMAINGVNNLKKAAGSGHIHTVRSGENLWSISKRYYGAGRYHQQILRANQQRLDKKERLKPGLKLIIPPLKN